MKEKAYKTQATITYTGEWEGTMRQSQVKCDTEVSHLGKRIIGSLPEKESENRDCEDEVKASFNLVDRTWWWLQMFCRLSGMSGWGKLGADILVLESFAWRCPLKQWE